MEISDILAGAAERLAEDESLRSNLDDKQAKALFSHTLRWLENRLKQAADVDPEQEIAQVVRTARSVNAAMKASQPPKLQETLEKMMPLTATVRSVDQATQQKASILRRMVGRLKSIWRRATMGDKPNA